MSRLIRNLIRGAASVLDIFPVPVHHRIESPTERRTAAEALHLDWCRVGEDLRGAINRGGHGQNRENVTAE